MVVLFAGTGVLLCLMLAAGVAALLAEPALEHTQQLPDGSRLSLLGTTYGARHELVLGPRWQRWLYPLLQPGQRARLQWHAQQYQTDKDALLFWTLHQPGAQPPDAEQRVVAFDEHGCESEAAQQIYGGEPRPEGRIDAWEARAFPRRGQAVGLRIYWKGAGNRCARAAEFLAANPTPGPHPAWTAEALPATRAEGDLAFALTRLRTGVSPRNLERPARAGEPLWSAASFRITRRGHPAPEWEPIHVTLSDAAGNHWQPLATPHSGPGGEPSLAIWETLWRDESAWKLRVEFARRSAFAPEELWTVRGLPIPPKDRNHFSQAIVRRFGTTIRLKRVAGPYANDPGDQTVGALYGTPSVWLQVDAPNQGVRVSLLRVTDDQGRPVTAGEMMDSFPGRFAAALPVRKGVKRVDLTFAIHRSRFAEFVAEAERP